MKTVHAWFLVAMVTAAALAPPTGYVRELPLLTERQGSFTFKSRTDYARHQCGFTAAEIAANLNELTALVNTMRLNPVLAGLKGFDCQTALYTVADCGTAEGYGLPVRVSFGICSWFVGKDGKPARNLIEPPEWSVMVNDLRSGTSHAFTSPEGRVYFSVPGVKKTIAPGIDVYDGEMYILYHPSRPPYWLPVTVREAAAAMLDAAKKDKDAHSRAFMLTFVEKEYAAFSEADRDKPAYTGGRNGSLPRLMGQVSADATGSPLVRINPDYWNKNLPRSSIQFMYCRINHNRAYHRKEKEELLKKNSTSYHLYRFLESLDETTASSLQRLIRSR